MHALVRGPHQEDLYNDNRCLFRCLAVLHGGLPRQLEHAAYQLLKIWLTFKQIPLHRFKGVQLHDIPEVEACFQVNINIYQLIDKDTAIAVYISTERHPMSLYCNLYKQHLSYISNFQAYARRFRCRCCDKFFSTSYNYKRHEKKCTGATKMRLPGKYWRMKYSLFEELEQHGIHVPQEERYYKMFITYNFEAILINRNNEKIGKGTKVLSLHKPISVAVASNICLAACQHDIQDQGCRFCRPLRQAICFVDAEEDKLLTKFTDHLCEIQNSAEGYYRSRFSWVFRTLDKQIAKLQGLQAEKTEGHEKQDAQALEVDMEDEQVDPRMAKMLKLPGTFNRFMKGLMQEDRWNLDFDDNEDADDADDVSNDEDEEESYGSYEEAEIKCQLKTFQRLKDQLDQYIRQIPVLGFNSSK